MLKLVTTFKPTQPPLASPGPQYRSVEIPSPMPTPAEMLELSLRGRSIDESCHSIPETYDAARIFCDKLALFFTHAYPGVDHRYQSAIEEILDAGVLGFASSASTAEPRVQLSNFLANGIKSATAVLTSYRVSQSQKGTVVDWEPWQHGGLAEWADWGGEPLKFQPAFAPTTEQRYATRGMLQHRLLRYHDVVEIHRAGIDIQSLDFF
jgi:hypothetical protein